MACDRHEMQRADCNRCCKHTSSSTSSLICGQGMGNPFHWTCKRTLPSIQFCFLTLILMRTHLVGTIVECWNQMKVNRMKHCWRRCPRFCGMLAKSRKWQSPCPATFRSSLTVTHTFRIRSRKRWNYFILKFWIRVMAFCENVICFCSCTSSKWPNWKICKFSWSDICTLWVKPASGFRQSIKKKRNEFLLLRIQFTEDPGAGALLFLYSAVMTRTPSK